jgi:hypothetical protein
VPGWVTRSRRQQLEGRKAGRRPPGRRRSATPPGAPGTSHRRPRSSEVADTYFETRRLV